MFTLLDYRPEYEYVGLRCSECGWDTFTEKNIYRQISPLSVLLKKGASVTCYHCGTTHNFKDGYIYPMTQPIYTPQPPSQNDSFLDLAISIDWNTWD